MAAPVCVNAHDLCWQGGPCPYCETPRRAIRGASSRVIGAALTLSPQPVPAQEPLPHGELTADEVREWFPDEDGPGSAGGGQLSEVL